MRFSAFINNLIDQQMENDNEYHVDAKKKRGNSLRKIQGLENMEKAEIDRI